VNLRVESTADLLWDRTLVKQPGNYKIMVVEIMRRCT